VTNYLSVILLRLEGPMQAWGIGSRFTDRHTEAEPTKSGVIGLLSSALGRSRDEDISDLSSMVMAVRVDREGDIVYDYHTTLDVLRAKAKGKITSSKLGTVVSRRFYIADACFLVGLFSNKEDLLTELIKALEYPKWPIFLGRKSFPASSPLLLSPKLIRKPLELTMKAFPWQGRKKDKRPKKLRLIIECEFGEGEPKLDVPVSFATREYLNRYLRTEFISTESLMDGE